MINLDHISNLLEAEAALKEAKADAAASPAFKRLDAAIKTAEKARKAAKDTLIALKAEKVSSTVRSVAEVSFDEQVVPGYSYTNVKVVPNKDLLASTKDEELVKLARIVRRLSA
jgi:hypothetical protein